jgi:hypothetical protein
MKNLFRVIFSIAIVLLLSDAKTRAPLNTYQVSVTGYFFGFDGKTKFPLVGARIELMDSDADGSTLFDDIMGSSHVQDDGSFSVSGSGGDPGSYWWSKPDVYIRVVYNNDQGVRLTDELNDDRNTDTPQHDHNNFEGHLNIGSWLADFDATDNGGHAAVWMSGVNAWNDYVKNIGGAPPAGKYDIEYWTAIWSGTPWTNDNTTHWPIGYPSDHVMHEFGHSIRHAADGDRNHFNWDVTRFRYARNHDMCDPQCNRISSDTHEMGLAFGFNEGWAEFWEGRSCGGAAASDECEGLVALELHLIEQANPLFNKQAMVATLKSNPGSIHSLDDFKNKLAQNISASHQGLQIPAFDRSSAAALEIKSVKYPSRLNEQIARIKQIIIDGEADVEALKKKYDSKKSERQNLVCKGTEDCYLTFQKAIDLPLSKAEILFKEEQLKWLSESISEQYLSRSRKAYADGKVDEFVRVAKEQRQRIRESIYKACFRDALVSARRIQGSTGEIQSLVDDLTAKSQMIMNTNESQKRSNRHRLLIPTLTTKGQILKKIG